MDRFTITLPLTDIDIILSALGEQPAKGVFGVITSVRLQVQNQMEATAQRGTESPTGDPTTEATFPVGDRPG